MADLAGRRALVTGGGTGIGYGCAERLLAAGAAVTIAGRRADVLADAASRLGGDVATVVYVRATPLGRAGSPGDIGDAVVFLAGDTGAWITGQAFGVDGGLNIPVMPSMASIAERLYGTELVAEIAIPDFAALNEEDRP